MGPGIGQGRAGLPQCETDQFVARGGGAVQTVSTPLADRPPS